MTENPVLELRIALTVDDFDQMVRLFRDSLGLPVVMDVSTPGTRGLILDAGKATLEIFDHAQAEYIDNLEAGERVSGPVRLALRVSDVEAAVEAGVSGGAALVHELVDTPWGDRNARIAAPNGLQITLYQSPPEE